MTPAIEGKLSEENAALIERELGPGRALPTHNRELWRLLDAAREEGPTPSPLSEEEELGVPPDDQAALVAPTQEGRAWRPIESAPRDGTEVDLWGFLDAPADRGEFAKRGRLIDCHFHLGDWLRWGTHNDDEGSYDKIFEPTHWMPLPAPPEGER